MASLVGRCPTSCPGGDRSQEPCLLHHYSHLNRRQARWSIFLANYDFEIVFHPGAQHGKVDALSRCLEFEIRPGDATYNQQSHCCLQPHHIQLFTVYMGADESLRNAIATNILLSTRLLDHVSRIMNSVLR